MQRRLAIGVAVGLIAASGAAFATASLFKLRQPKVERLRLTPAPIPGRGWAFAPQRGSARVRFKLHESGHTTAAIVDAHGVAVRRLAVVRARGANASVSWDGKNETGRPSPDGRYTLRLRLPGRTITLNADPLSLDRRVELARLPDVGRVERSADPDRRRITPSTRAHPVRWRLAVNVRGNERLHDVTVTFRPTAGGSPFVLHQTTRRAKVIPFTWRATNAPPGRYAIEVRVHDLVGNEVAVDGGTVLVRTVLLMAPAHAMRPGGVAIVGVSSDSSRFGIFLCRLAAPRCDRTTSVDPNLGKPGTVRVSARFHLPQGLRPGVYVAQADYHGARPRVVVPVRSIRPVKVLLVTGGPTGAVVSLARGLDARDVLFDAVTSADLAGGVTAYTTIVVPPGTPLDAAGRAAIASSGAHIVTTLKGLPA